MVNNKMCTRDKLAYMLHTYHKDMLRVAGYDEIDTDLFYRLDLAIEDDGLITDEYIIDDLETLQ